MTKFRTGDRFFYCEATMDNMYVLANDNGDFLGAFNKKEDAVLASHAQELLAAADGFLSYDNTIEIGTRDQWEKTATHWLPLPLPPKG